MVLVASVLGLNRLLSPAVFLRESPPSFVVGRQHGRRSSNGHRVDSFCLPLISQSFMVSGLSFPIMSSKCILNDKAGMLFVS